ncbi:AbrB family transcriptional regulator [Sporosarcina sp. ACRSL]|uniref:AbrB family transcriptional regulator n=1 Tax=Sporosarcina sp. ACRSL TaxID=2918215 RepID=UPI001EF4B7DF
MKLVISSLLILTFCTVGGAALTVLDLSVGWMIGSLLVSVLLFNAGPIKKQVEIVRGEIMGNWLKIGQLLLGIELGLQLNLSILITIKNNIIPIASTIVLSLLFSLGSGFLLFKFCKVDKLTSFYSTAPGGLSAMPGMAHEAGANTGVVTILQTMRILLVVISIPIFISISQNPIGEVKVTGSGYDLYLNKSDIDFIWTLILFVIAFGGVALVKRLRFPVPWLIGSMMVVAFARTFYSLSLGDEFTAFWPEEVMVISQIMIGASIGSFFNKIMFTGIRKVLLFSFLSTIGLIFIMMLCAYMVSILTGIPFVTTALAFAPGGVAEMTTASVILQADPLFVVAVQILRVLIVNITLPPLFSYLDKGGLESISLNATKNDRK